MGVAKKETDFWAKNGLDNDSLLMRHEQIFQYFFLANHTFFGFENNVPLLFGPFVVGQL